MLLITRGRFSRSVLILGVIGLLSLTALPTSGQIEQQCPTELLTISSNGTITFSPLSNGSGPVDASYDPGAAGGWYALANGFIDAVRPGGLPFEIIIPVVNQTFLQSSSSASFDPLAFLQQFGSLWAGILAVTLLGCALAISFCICGCCFWCCRCCGNCGGAKTQKTRDNNDCLTFTFAIILLLCTFILLAAVVLAFFSNEQTFKSVENLRVTLNNVAGDAVNYLSDTVEEVYDIFCQLADDGGVVTSINTQIQGIVPELESTIQDVSTQVNSIINSLNITAIQEANAVVGNISTTNADLASATSMLSTSLTNVLASLMSLQTSCAMVSSAVCGSSLTPIINSVQTASDSVPTLPNIDAELQVIQDALGDIDFQVRNQSQLADVLGPQVLDQINSTINGLFTSQINQYVDPIFGLANQIVTEINPILNNTVPSECPALEQSLTDVQLPQFNFDFSLTPGGGGGGGTGGTGGTGTTLNVGYIRQCIVNAAFDFIADFDVYRYAFGIIVCSLSLITIVLVWIGVLCGLIGFRKDRYPNDRSSLSHCGGICLLVSVGVTFLFGFFLLLLSAIFFFFGANALKVCQSLQGPNYDIFAQTIDTPTIRSGLLQGLVGNQIDLNTIPSVSGFFRDCEENNTALFTAANLGAILSSTGTLPPGSESISGIFRNLLNITALQSTVDTELQNVVSNFNIDPTQFTALVQSGIDQFQNFSVMDFNVTGYTAQLDMIIVQADLNGSIEELRNLSIQFGTLGQSSLQMDVDATILELENIRDNIIPNIRSQLDELNNQLDQITAIQADILANAAQLLTSITDVLNNISGPVLDNFVNVTVRGRIDRAFGYVDQYLNNLDYQVENTVGGCQPIYGMYTQFHNALCRNFLDGLNGFWWSLGFCSVLFIPVIIFAVVAASFFLKKKPDENSDDGYLEYPMKNY